MSASSHTEWRGQLLRHASIASAYVRGRLATQARSSSMSGLEAGWAECIVIHVHVTTRVAGQTSLVVNCPFV
jgi:hypothetical protein